MSAFSEQDRRELGSTGIRVAPLSLGTVKLGRNTGVKYPESFNLPEDESIVALLQLASDSGINLLDTAPAYGESEARIGRLLPGQRHDWILCTKAGEFFDGTASRFDYSGQAIETSVLHSLTRLRTDYLDVVLIHSNGSDEDIIANTDALDTLHRLKEKGMIRSLGMSVKTLAGAMAALSCTDVLMVTFNLRDRSQLPVIQQAAELGVGILLKKVLDSGHSRDPARSLTEALSLPGVHSVVTGTLSPAHLQENVNSTLACLAS